MRQVPLASLPQCPASLVLVGPAGQPDAIVLRTTPGDEPQALCALRIDTETPLTTLLTGAPDRLVVSLADRPLMAPLALTLLSEGTAPRCGHMPMVERLAEATLIMVLRGVIDSYPPDGAPGLLAGLAHPRLHHALVALHDAPGDPWTTEALAARAGMSRSSFIDSFNRTLGTSPGAYVSAWRMTRARAALQRGGALRDVAEDSGFSSPEAFSRAFRRHHGVPPSTVRRAAG